MALRKDAKPGWWRMQNWKRDPKVRTQTRRATATAFPSPIDLEGRAGHAPTPRRHGSASQPAILRDDVRPETEVAPPLAQNDSITANSSKPY